VGRVSRARGSSYVELGKTKVICAVYGPREVTRRDEVSLRGQLNCVVKFATFSCRDTRRGHQQDSEERELGEVVREALEPAVMLGKFPKARLDIFLTVLEDDGSALSAALTAASLALINAGIELFDIVIGASCRQVDDITLVDPTFDEENYRLNTKSFNDFSLTIGYMPSLHQVSGLLVSGVSDEETNEKCIRLCVAVCLRMYPLVQKCLEKKM